MDFDKPKVYGDTSITDGLVSHCEGSQKCIFHALQAPTILLSHHFVTEQQQTVRENWGFLKLDENDFFLV